MATTEEWIDELKSISVLELSERIKAIEETFGVSAAAPVAVAAAPAGGGDGGGAAAAEEQTAFTVSLDAAGDKKIQVIKVVRAVTGLGLKEAKELVDNAPSNVKEGVAKEEADQVKAQLEEAGGIVSVKLSRRVGGRPCANWPIALGRSPIRRIASTRPAGRRPRGSACLGRRRGSSRPAGRRPRACAWPPAAGAAVLGQGGVRMGADAMWSRDVLGQGQTVAIVDQGFAGLDRSIELGELPPRDRLEIRLFDPGGAEGGLTELGLPTQHGVRMAELIHDLAPDARLVLVGYRTPEQFARGRGVGRRSRGSRSRATPTRS